MKQPDTIWQQRLTANHEEIREILIREGCIAELPRVGGKLGATSAFVIAEEDLSEQAARYVAEAAFEKGILSVHFEYPRSIMTEELVGRFMMSFDPSCDCLVGIGGRFLHDFCKYAAKLLRKPYYFIPTEPITEGLISSRCTLLRNGELISLEGNYPAAVFCDPALLLLSDKKCTAAAMSGIICGCISLVEWLTDSRDMETARYVKSALEDALNQSIALSHRSEEGFLHLMTAASAMALIESGENAAMRLARCIENRLLAAKRPLPDSTLLLGLCSIAVLESYRVTGNERAASVLPELSSLEEMLLTLDAPVNPAELYLLPEDIEIALVLCGMDSNAAHRTAAYFDTQESYFTALHHRKLQILSGIKCFVLDMDGTIYLGNDLFPYTKAFLEKVDHCGKDFFFYTNNSSKNKEAYIEKLRRMEIPIDPYKMMISNQVIIQHIKKEHPGKSAYVCGTEYLVEDFRKAEIPLDDQDPDIVVLGFDVTLDYEKLRKVCDFVRAGKIYYAVNPDFNCPVEGGGFLPDCGSMARLVEGSTGRVPEFFGKPSRHTLDFIVSHTGFEEGEIAVIGDRLYTDIAVTSGSRASGILVLSGEAKPEDLPASSTKPDMICRSLEEVTELLTEIYG